MGMGVGEAAGGFPLPTGPIDGPFTPVSSGGPWCPLVARENRHLADPAKDQRRGDRSVGILTVRGFFLFSLPAFSF